MQFILFSMIFFQKKYPSKTFVQLLSKSILFYPLLDKNRSTFVQIYGFLPTFGQKQLAVQKRKRIFAGRIKRWKWKRQRDLSGANANARN